MDRAKMRPAEGGDVGVGPETVGRLVNHSGADLGNGSMRGLKARATRVGSRGRLFDDTGAFCGGEFGSKSGVQGYA